MRSASRIPLLLVLASASAFAGEARWSSAHLNLTAKELGVTSDARPAVSIGLAGRENRLIWVRVRIESEGSDVVHRVDSKRTTTFNCPVDSLRADVDYTVTIAVFTDSALAQKEEEAKTTARFTPKELRGLAAMQKAIQLPQTYAHMSYVAKIGVGAATFGTNGAYGDVIVKPDGLEFRTPKYVVRVAASQIQGTRMIDPTGKNDPWLVVDYNDGQAKTFAIKPHDLLIVPNLTLVRISIQHLYDTTHPAP